MKPIEGPVPTRLAAIHGLGSIAYGVKDNGFSTFLLLYYNQVLGMDAKLVSFALMLALVIDGFADPLLGHLSDRTRSRWGRRLPWLYLAPIPLALAWMALWARGTAPGFVTLVVSAIVVRTLVSACEVPSVALVPEITRDYDERTRLMRYRYLFGWGGGLLMLMLAYDVFLADGLLNRRGYLHFGIVGGALMALAVLISAAGQHRWVSGPPETVPEPLNLKGAFHEIRESLSHPAFLILMGAGALAYTSQGVTFSIANYLYLFVWRLTPQALSFYPWVLFAGVLGAFFTLGPMHRRWGKRGTGVVTAVVGMVFWVAPFYLRAIGWWFAEGSTASFTALFAFFFLANIFSVAAMISVSSMVADVVEASQAQTGRRTEATFFAGNFLMQKCSTGLGIFVTGLVLDSVGLPPQASPGTVAPQVIDALSLSYALIVTLFAFAIAVVLRRFPITREDHAARVAALSSAARAAPDAEGVHP